MFDALRVVASYEYGLDIADGPRGMGDTIQIDPQVKIGPYRADFLVRFRFDSERQISIIVECDGHDFHERTKAQASRDKRRDRAMQRLGYEVYRFTGADVHLDCYGCARDVLGAVMDWYGRQADEAMNGKNSHDQA